MRSRRYGSKWCVKEVVEDGKTVYEVYRLINMHRPIKAWNTIGWSAYETLEEARKWQLTLNSHI